MRFKLKLKSGKKHYLPSYYNYQLILEIYKLLGLIPAEKNGQAYSLTAISNMSFFNLFSFALQLTRFEVSEYFIKLLDREVTLYISAEESVLKNLKIEDLATKHITLSSDIVSCRLSITDIEILPEPSLNEHEKFYLHSPLVLSKKRFVDDVEVHYYLREYDINDINILLNKDLAEKYKLLNGKEYTGDGVVFKWDIDYLKRKDKVTRRTVLKETKEKFVEVYGIQAPFYLTGDPALMEAGYKCGFGELTALGFGLAELAKEIYI